MKRKHPAKKKRKTFVPRGVEGIQAFAKAYHAYCLSPDDIDKFRRPLAQLVEGKISMRTRYGKALWRKSRVEMLVLYKRMEDLGWPVRMRWYRGEPNLEPHDFPGMTRAEMRKTFGGRQYR